MSHDTPSESRAARLKRMMTGPEVTILMEAHNGLSAKLAVEAGFGALWGSGLAISAALGVRDSNEASWTQVLEVLEFMADAVDVPILLDGDTGYGNFNNVRRLVKKLEQRGVAGVCLEDKLFPKTNSFIDGERQALAEVDEFCGKLRAACDTRRDDDFVVVARTEAFIAGWGLDEAILRATAYARSGADVILVHSKRPDSREIMAFMERWSGETPVVIVPTKYPSEPLGSFVERGITNFIFANQSLRTVITALQRNLAVLHETRDLMSLEADIAPVSEIFRLQDVQELKRSEARYLPGGDRDPARALVLAASQGKLGDLVADRPKCMVPVKGRPILSWQVEAFRKAGIRQVGVVRGYRKEAVDLPGLHAFDNDRYAETGELASLYAARDFLKGELLLAYGDVIFDDAILRGLLAEEAPVAIAADAAFENRQQRDAARDMVATRGIDDPVAGTTCELVAIGPDVAPGDASGEWVGLVHTTAEGTRRLAEALDRLAAEAPERLARGSLPELLSHLASAGERVAVVHSYGHWRDIDDEADVRAADRGA